MNLDELQHEAEKLLSLLNNRQPGTISWNMFMEERLRNIAKLIADAGIKSADANRR